MMTEKLLLEEVFKKYCLNDADGIESIEPTEDDIQMANLIRDWVKVRLRVSGGNEHTMGSVGMETISGFLNEIEYHDDVTADWAGEYRGTLKYESRDTLFYFIDEIIKDEDFKNRIKKEYNERFFKNEEEYDYDY